MPNVLAVGAVEFPEDAVFAGAEHELLALIIDENALEHLIQVQGFAGSVVKPPFELPGIQVQRDGRVRIVGRAVARSAGRPHPGLGLRDSPIGQVQIQIDAASDPGVAACAQQIGKFSPRVATWLPGSREAVRRVAVGYTLGLASSSNRELIDLVLEAGGIAPLFRVSVSSDEVSRGKPAPDVYLEAARRLEVEPARCAAVEDSHNGIRSAKAAGMWVVAVPNAHYPPDDEALALADVVVPSIGELQVEHFAV